MRESMPEKSDAPDSKSGAASERKTKFSVDILKIASGTVIAQGIGTVASLLIARLFAPEAFGINALLLSVIGVIAPVSALRYELAIMQPQQDSEAANLAAGGFIITTLFSLLLIPIIGFGGPAIAGWLNAPELKRYLWLVPVFIFFGGFGSGHPIMTAWSTRKRDFSQISITQVLGTAFSSSMKVVLGLLGFNSSGSLVAGGLAGSTLPPALLGWHIWKQDRDLFVSSVRLPLIWESLKRYRKFAIYNVPAGVLNNLSWQVPSFLLAVFFSPTVVGYYAFGNQLLRIPMNLIGISIARAFHSHAATALREGKLAEFVEDTFRHLVEYSFFPILMLTLVGKELCVVVFGSEWAEAGVYLQILSAWMVFWFISSPIGRLFSILEKNELSLGVNVVVFVTRVASIWIGGILGSPRLALVLFSVTGALLYGYLSVYITYISGVSWKKLLWILFQNLMIFILAGGGILLLKIMHVYDWIQVGASIFFVGIYFAYRLKDQDPFKRWIFKLGALKSGK